MIKHLTYANVMASVAVFVALGGSSYAAVKLSGKDIRNGSLTGVDVKDRSLTSKDLKKGAVATTRWLLINEAGDIDEQSGGFTVISKPGINGQPATNPNIYVDAGSSLVGKGLSATIAIQNLVDRDGNGTADPAFKGDAAVGRCNTPVVACAPMGTNTNNVLAVRALADNSNGTSQSRRVHVQVIP